jgi:hypothetical protein
MLNPVAINVPIVAAAIVCTARVVPESRAARARRFDPVGQTLVTFVLGSAAILLLGLRSTPRTR